MNSLFLLLALPFLLGLCVAAVSSVIRRAPVAAGYSLATIFWIAAFALLPQTMAREPLAYSAEWVPALGVDFTLSITAFSAWFGVLIFAIGGCILLYAASYFSKNPRLPFLLSCLLLFTGFMLGVIWSDNLYLLFLFWEGTSLLSFLLVGFHHDQESTREKASQALLVTFTGGAAMLAGFICLHLQFDTSSISELLTQTFISTPLTTAAVLLIILGAVTKSAQFPFHFWLPNAMAGPTPVSAFLHSATMVKAGVFLLATLAPLLSAHSAWTPILVTSGLLTVVISIIRGCRDDDMKGILASTTLAALGFLTVLAGIGTPEALKAFVIFLTAHALYKAPLFLSAGNLEKTFGTRQLSQLGGAIWSSPIVGGVIVMSIASLVGIPPFSGFLGKEYLLKALWAESPLLTAIAGVIAAGSICVGFRLITPLLSRKDSPKEVHSLPLGMTVATAIPALISLLLVATFAWISQPLLGNTATSLGAERGSYYSYWHGFTPALGIGLTALIVGLIASRFTRSSVIEQSLFESAFNTTIIALRTAGYAVAHLLQNGRLSTHLSWMLVGIGALAVISLRLGEWPEFTSETSSHSLVFILIAPALIIAAVIAARAQAALTQLVSLGFVGLLIAFLYLWFSAPDLALTQLLAETLVLFLLAGVFLRFEAKKPRKDSSPWRLIIASASGLLVTLLILKAMALEWDHPVSDYYVENSKSVAFGANVVNVILVDFRALDTLGEIVVLAIAALGANAALGAARNRAPLPANDHSPWLETVFPLITALLIPTALWIFWRGHNAPGGGFIAALLVATAIGLSLLGTRPKLTAHRLRTLSKRLLISGLTLSLASALLPVFVGKTFFTGLWWHSGDLHLGTPLLFDLGVFLTVIGFSVSYLRHFHLSRIS